MLTVDKNVENSLCELKMATLKRTLCFLCELMEKIGNMSDMQNIFFVRCQCCQMSMWVQMAKRDSYCWQKKFIFVFWFNLGQLRFIFVIFIQNLNLSHFPIFLISTLKPSFILTKNLLRTGPFSSFSILWMLKLTEHLTSSTFLKIFEPNTNFQTVCIISSSPHGGSLSDYSSRFNTMIAHPPLKDFRDNISNL